MKESEISKIVKPEDQTEQDFKVYINVLKKLPKLTNEQLSSLGFEIWCTAKSRSPQ